MTPIVPCNGYLTTSMYSLSTWVQSIAQKHSYMRVHGGAYSPLRISTDTAEQQKGPFSVAVDFMILNQSSDWLVLDYILGPQ